MRTPISTPRVQALAEQCGFEVAGVASADPISGEFDSYQSWVAQGRAGVMSYLTDHRAGIRSDPKQLLQSARSVVCVGRLYGNGGSAPIARYARSEDYHETMRRDLHALVQLLKAEYGDFEHRICVDTAPLLERSYARLAGLGWIGRNTCLINQDVGSYLYLGEILTSLEPQAGFPAPDRCGTCTRCIDACPTAAIVPGGIRTELDATRCIAYLTIEVRGDIPVEFREGTGTLAFGCDICQEVCPWNRRAPVSCNSPETYDLPTLASMTPDEFRLAFRHTPLWRGRYQGLLRNVAVAMGNSGEPDYRPALEKLSESEDPVIRSHAQWALDRISKVEECRTP